MLSLFGKRLVLTCPFCLDERTVRAEETRCAECRMEYPRAYRDEPSAAPLFVPLIGWSQVGKTNFLQAITLALDNMGRVWPNYPPPEAATEATWAFLRNARAWRANGDLPESTQIAANDAFVMALHGMPRWKSRCLVIRDWGGEWFEKWSIESHPKELAPFESIWTLLQRARTAFLMYPLTEIWKPTGTRTIDELAGFYVETLRKRGSDVRNERRKFIVVLSKADEALAKEEFLKRIPDNILSYLERDPVRAAIAKPGISPTMDEKDIGEYMNTLQNVSDAIQQWLNAESDVGTRLIRRCRQHNIDVRFTILSSLPDGVDPVTKKARQAIPVRALDPLFWALDIHTV